nr:D-alanyl-D-alanine carboxypeptidase [Gluconobacter wancherniae]
MHHPHRQPLSFQPSTHLQSGPSCVRFSTTLRTVCPCSFTSSSAAPPPLSPHTLAKQLSPILKPSQDKGVRWGDGWSWNNLPTQWGTAVSALTLNDNTTELTVQPGAHPSKRPITHWSAPDDGLSLLNQALTVPEDKPELNFEKKPGASCVVLAGILPLTAPTQILKIGLDDLSLSTAHHFKSLLHEAGIRVQTAQVRPRLTKTAADTPTLDALILATLPAPDLKGDIHHLLKVSQNLHAELLLRRLALVRGNGSVADGLTERSPGAGRARPIYRRRRTLRRLENIPLQPRHTSKCHLTPAYREPSAPGRRLARRPSPRSAGRNAGAPLHRHTRCGPPARKNQHTRYHAFPVQLSTHHAQPDSPDCHFRKRYSGRSAVSDQNHG